MQLTTRHSYDATPAAVWAMFIDPAFRDDVCQATGATTWTVDIAADDGGGTVTVTRTMTTAGSPAVRKVVGDTVTVVQTETWGAPNGSGVRRAEVLLDVVGKPAAMRATSELSAAGTGAVMAVEGALEVRVPLFGGRLEQELAKAVRAGLATEHEVGRRYLS